MKLRIMGRALLAFCLVTPAIFAADISGKWELKVQTDNGVRTPTVVLKQAGENLTGTYTGMLGTTNLTGTVKGGDIEFTTELAFQGQKAKVIYKGKIEALGSMQGTVEMTGLGSGTWTATKKE